MNKDYQEGYEKGMAHCQKYGIVWSLAYAAGRIEWALSIENDDALFRYAIMYWSGVLAAIAAHTTTLFEEEESHESA